MSHHINMIGTPRYWVNDKCEFYWEIVNPEGFVEKYIEKTFGDDNRDVAERACRRLNKKISGNVATMAAIDKTNPTAKPPTP